MFTRSFSVIALVAFSLFSSLSAADKTELPAQEADWVAGPDSTWFLHYDAAAAAAKKDNKLIYALRTGSDWCMFCVRLRKDVFDSDEFRDFTKENFVLLYLDMPQNALPENQQKHNNMVASKIKFGRGVPCAVILSPDGKPLETISGYRPKNVYMKMLKEIVRNHSSAVKKE